MVAKKPVTYRIITLDDDTEVRKLFKECPGHDKNPHEVMQDDFVKKIKGAHGLSTYCKACNSVIFKRQDYKKTKRDKPGYDNPRKRKHEVINGVQHVFCGKCNVCFQMTTFLKIMEPNQTVHLFHGMVFQDGVKSVIINTNTIVNKNLHVNGMGVHSHVLFNVN